jgi:hypothetical protein
MVDRAHRAAFLAAHTETVHLLHPEHRHSFYTADLGSLGSHKLDHLHHTQAHHLRILDLHLSPLYVTHTHTIRWPLHKPLATKATRIHNDVCIQCDPQAAPKPQSNTIRTKLTMSHNPRHNHSKKCNRHGLHLPTVQSLYKLHYMRLRRPVANCPSPHLSPRRTPLELLVEPVLLHPALIGVKCPPRRLATPTILPAPVEDDTQEEEAEGVADVFRRNHLAPTLDCYAENLPEEPENPPPSTIGPLNRLGTDSISTLPAVQHGFVTLRQMPRPNTHIRKSPTIQYSPQLLSTHPQTHCSFTYLR